MHYITGLHGMPKPTAILGAFIVGILCSVVFALIPLLQVRDVPPLQALRQDFLSADLGRAARLLADHPNVSLDLAPGIELYYNLSRDPARSRFTNQS